MDPSTSDVSKEDGTIAISAIGDQKIVLLHTIISGVSSCKQIHSSLTSSASAGQCPVVRKCNLLEDDAPQNLCLWKCLCEEEVCEVKIFGGLAAVVWEICEIVKL